MKTRNIKTNAICRNPLCKVEFVSCSYCIKTQSWRSVCCSLDCYNTYAQLVDEIRAKNKNINIREAFLPQRTDISEAEVIKIQTGTHKEAAEIANRELTDMGYGEELNEIGLVATIDKMNAEIKETQSKIDEPVKEENLNKPYETKRTRKSKNNSKIDNGESV